VKNFKKIQVIASPDETGAKIQYWLVFAWLRQSQPQFSESAGSPIRSLL